MVGFIAGGQYGSGHLMAPGVGGWGGGEFGRSSERALMDGYPLIGGDTRV